MSETLENPLSEAVACTLAAELVEPPTLNELYKQYMAALEEQVEADAARHAAETELRAIPEFAALARAENAALQARQSADEALAAVKAATISAFQKTGERQPHPYAGIKQITRLARYDTRLALRWLRERPDYQHLIKPETLDAKGFEKLARGLADAGIAVRLDNGGQPVDVVEWDEIPVVSVKIREED